MNLSPDLEGYGVPGWDRSTTWLFGTVFSLASMVLYGNAQLSAYGFDLSGFLSSTALSFEPLSISVASIASLLSIAAVYFGNNRDITEFNDHQTGIGIVTGLLVLMTTVSSDLTSAVAGGTSGIIFTAFLMIGFISMAELGGMEK